MPNNRFIRYNDGGPYYEYDTSVAQDGSGPWLILPIDGTQITTGTVNPSRLGSGVGAGKFLRGDSTWQTIDLSAVWPVGSVYIAVVSTNPATLLGFGTWAAFATGRTLVGIDVAQTEFDVVEETGGAKTHTLVIGEITVHTHVQDTHTHTQNSHNHTQDTHNHTQNSHTHSIFTPNTAGGSNQLATSGGNGTYGNNLVAEPNHVQGTVAVNQTTVATNQATTATNQNTVATNQNAGGGGAHNNLQPYIVVYMWKRTA